jgi:SNF2 family DNA or RNA helicase
MIKAEITDNGRIGLLSDLGIRDKDRIQMIPGARWNSGLWTVPLSWGSCLTARGVFGHELQLGPELTQWGFEVKTKMDRAMELRTSVEADGPDVLRPYQRAAVKWGATVGHGLLADDMGLGKTVESLYIMQQIKEDGGNPFPLLVVCRNSLMTNWQDEIKKWFPTWSVAIIWGSLGQRRKIIEEDHDVFIISYDNVITNSRQEYFHGGPSMRRCHVCDSSLQGDVYRGKERPADKAWPQHRCESCPKELNTKGFRAIIVDEAHSIKNPHAKVTRSVWALGATAKYRFGLTGTPVDRSVADLWSILHFIDRDSFPTKGKFVDRYCQVGLNEFGGMVITGFRYDTQHELFGFLNPIMRRMPKELVAPDLPPKVFSTRQVWMTGPQQKAYDELKGKMMTMLGDGILLATESLSLMTRLVQLSQAMLEITVHENEDGSKAETVRMTNPSPVLDELMNVIEDMGGKPIVVMSKSRQLLDLARERLEKASISHSVVVGGQDPMERSENVRWFQEGYHQVCLCSQSVAKEGLTLTRADTLVFISKSFSNIENLQAVDRVHRIGSEHHETINIITIEPDNPSMRRLNELLYEKEMTLQSILQDDKLIKEVLGS